MNRKIYAAMLLTMLLLGVCFITMDSDDSEAAGTYTIRVGVSDTGCSVTISSPGKTPQTAYATDVVSMTINQGASVTLTASAGTGYAFEQWTNRNTLAVLSTNATYTFTPTSDMTISGDFDYLTGYVIGVQIPATDTGCSATITSGGSSQTATPNEWVRMSISQGASVTLTSSAGTGYTFGSWKSNGSTLSSNSTYTFTPTGDMDITADFDPITYTITFVTSPNDYGYIDMDSAPSAVGNTISVGYGTQFYVSNSGAVFVYTSPFTQFVYAEPNADSGGYRYSFDSWSIPDGTTVTVTGNMTVTAYFTRSALTTVTLSVDAQYTGCRATIYSEGRSLTVNAGSSATFSFGQGSTVNLGASAGISYNFSKWTSNDSDLSTSNPYSTTSLVSGATIKAVFAAATTTTIFYQNYNDADMTVYNVKGQTIGYTFSLPTNPTRAGYTFVGWFTERNGGTQITSSTTVTADSPTSLYAHWSNSQYTLTFLPMGGTVNPGSTTVTYLSTYGSGGWPTPSRADYDFLGWYSAANGGYRIESSDTYTDTSNKTIYAHWAASVYTIVLSVPATDGGCSATITSGGSQTVNAGDSISFSFVQGASVTLTSSAGTGYTFGSWKENNQALSSNPTYVFTPTRNMTIVADFNQIIPSAYWSNDLYNGKVDILFQFDSSDNKAHTLSMDLMTGIIGADQTTTWITSPYSLEIGLYYPSLSVSATLSGGGQDISNTMSLGNWGTFILSIDTDKGKVEITPIKTFESFTSYTTYSNQTRTILDFSERASGLAVYEIEHTEEDGTNAPRFSVVGTSVFLNTFGVVLYNPTINLYDYFPQYNAIRVNFYSFALYGESITINGHTWNVDGSKISIQYVSDGSEHYLPGVMPNATIQTRTFELTNIYVTYQDGHCYLTFVNDRFTLDLGAYTANNETISMVGLWYFATMVYEPYTAYEKELSDWKTIPETNGSQMVLMFIGILIVAGAALAIHVRKSGLGIIDLVIVAGAAVVGLLMLG